MWMSSFNKTKHHSIMMNQQEPQPQQPVLPSFHAFCKTIEDQTPPPTPTPTTTLHHGTNNNKNHIRTTSMPTRLPSQQIEQEKQKQERLSLEVLLDAIELDQSMYEAYQQEWSKTSAMRPHCPNQRNAVMAAAYRRRRSKSAPGIPRWRTPSSTPQRRNVNVQQIAESIVQKHIEYARKK
ncbi:hypothetical protein BDA99DRAFT_521638 [Phascolomyces articulosus]|uniref:Uncharacterized protein n=1 Tax=Phascolomyces articulosus TaxID=60185 RepID=A0AAD5JRM0_9FUNG|nr:hypothetical protein BDA99DRAFT_521638 [Phascolomyces articulosus]